MFWVFGFLQCIFWAYRMRERNLMFAEDIDAPEVFLDESAANEEEGQELEEEDIGEDPYWHLTPEDLKNKVGTSLLMNRTNVSNFSKTRTEQNS